MSTICRNAPRQDKAEIARYRFARRTGQPIGRARGICVRREQYFNVEVNRESSEVVPEDGGLLRNGESFAVATIFDKLARRRGQTVQKCWYEPTARLRKHRRRTSGSGCHTFGPGELSAKQTVIQSFDLTGKDAAGMDMICGGKGEVLIDFVDAGDENSRLVYEAAAEIYERGEKAWLITILDRALGGLV